MLRQRGAAEARQGREVARHDARAFPVSGQSKGVSELVDQHARELRPIEAPLPPQGVLRPAPTDPNPRPLQARGQRCA